MKIKRVTDAGHRGDLCTVSFTPRTKINDVANELQRLAGWPESSVGAPMEFTEFDSEKGIAVALLSPKGFLCEDVARLKCLAKEV